MSAEAVADIRLVARSYGATGVRLVLATHQPTHNVRAARPKPILFDNDVSATVGASIGFLNNPEAFSN